MIRDSILRCLDRLSAACNSVNALVDELRKERITFEETRWLFFGIGQLLPQYFEPKQTMAGILSLVRDKLERANFEFAAAATQALKEGMQSNPRKPPNV